MYITSSLPVGHSEGAGSENQRFLFAYLYAISNGLQYVHRPSSRYFAHDDLSHMSLAESEWSKIFGFLNKSKPISLPVKRFKKLSECCPEYIYKISFSKAYAYINALHIEDRENLLDIIRHEFIAHNKSEIESIAITDKFVISIHLRALSPGDVLTSYDSFPWQHFNFDYGLPDNNPHYYAKLYAKAINEIARQNSKKNVILHIHSTESFDVFESLLDLLDDNIQVEFFLKESAPKAFMDMINADILIASHSSFSWLPLLLRTKPSYIRKGFRHFVSMKTQLIDEVLYDDCSFLGRILIYMRLKFAYCVFYPKYFFSLITNGIFIRINL